MWAAASSRVKLAMGSTLGSPIGLCSPAMAMAKSGPIMVVRVGRAEQAHAWFEARSRALRSATLIVNSFSTRPRERLAGGASQIRKRLN